MRKKNNRKRQAVRLLEHGVGQYKLLAGTNISHQPNTDTSVATFERYLKRLEGLVDVPGAAPQFWALHQKVYIRLLKCTLKLRD
jgi:hypothetical protein